MRHGETPLFGEEWEGPLGPVLCRLVPERPERRRVLPPPIHLSPPFYRWKARLAAVALPVAATAPPASAPRPTPAPATAPGAGSTPAAFVPVRLLDRLAPLRSTPTTVVELALRDGRPVRIAADLTAEGVARLLAALEGTAC